jgi:hypothetical protein
MSRRKRNMLFTLFILPQTLPTRSPYPWPRRMHTTPRRPPLFLPQCYQSARPKGGNTTPLTQTPLHTQPSITSNRSTISRPLRRNSSQCGQFIQSLPITRYTNAKTCRTMMFPMHGMRDMMVFPTLCQSTIRITSV